MSSFSQKVKREICKKIIAAPCCINSTCYGVACFAKYFDARGLVLHTERAYIAQWAKSVFSDAGIRGKVYVRGKEKTGQYEFAVKDPFEIEKMLALFGHDVDETAMRIHSENLLCDGCFAAFVSAAFLCGGTMVTPEKGYNLEFISSKYQLSKDFENLLFSHDFLPKKTVRKGLNIIYFRASEQIEDLLTLMGATKASLEIMNLKVYKDFRNKANRITNCETANIDKMVFANSQTIAAINFLECENAFETLPEPLKIAANFRKNYPELSLMELVEYMPEKISKSGLSHRYRKICKISNELKAKLEAKKITF